MKLLITPLLILTFSAGHISTAQSFQPTWESLGEHETPSWFQDAVLGIYFHWGPYSVPAFGCWGGRNMYQPEGGEFRGLGAHR